MCRRALIPLEPLRPRLPVASNKKVGSRPLERATFLEATHYSFVIPETQVLSGGWRRALLKMLEFERTSGFEFERKFR